MIIVRNSFVAKPGQASKLAKLLKEVMVAMQMPNGRVLTDVTGEFNRVEMEFEVEDIAGFQAALQTYSTSEVMREKMKGYTDLWTTGNRELLQVVK